MKLLPILLLISLSSFSQEKYKFKLKEHGLPLTAIFLAGVSDGVQDFVSFKYDGSDSFWQPATSWRNKYKDNDPTKGERFFGSTTVFVGFTDGFHAMKLSKNVFTISAVTLRLVKGEKKNWKHYILDAIIYYAVNRAGFCISYNLLQKL